MHWPPRFYSPLQSPILLSLWRHRPSPSPIPCQFMQLPIPHGYSFAPPDPENSQPALLKSNLQHLQIFRRRQKIFYPCSSRKGLGTKIPRGNCWQVSLVNFVVVIQGIHFPVPWNSYSFWSRNLLYIYPGVSVQKTLLAEGRRCFRDRPTFPTTSYVSHVLTIPGF